MSPAPDSSHKLSPKRAGAERQAYAPVFAALGDPTRLSLVAALSGGEPRSIAQLTQGTPLTRQAITRHLQVLEEAGIVHSARAGRESLYAFDAAPIAELRAYLDRVSTQWDEALGRLQRFVEGGD